MLLFIILGMAMILVYSTNIKELKDEWFLEELMAGVLGIAMGLALCFLEKQGNWIQGSIMFIGAVVTNFVTCVITALLIMNYTGATFNTSTALS